MAVNGYNISNNSKNNTKSDLSISTNINATEDKDGMNDGGYSSKMRNAAMDSTSARNIDDDHFTGLLHATNIYRRHEIDVYNKTYRFGLLNPFGAVTSAREFLFFTKPDLHIFERDDLTGSLTGNVVEGLRDIPYWADMCANRKKTIELLQLSLKPQDNFNHLLQNQVISNLEIPGLSSETIDTATNMYGVGLSYRGSSEASDDNLEFSLEFKDSRWLDTYYFFKTYEEYETLKHHGVIRPWMHYIEHKIIHDQFSIYKFLVDEDMETILYYGKMYGVMPKSLPRDTFSNSNFDNGISYSVDFKAAFYEDMRPEILSDFNEISRDYYNSLPYRIDMYNDVFGRADNRPAQAAYVEKVKSIISPTGFVYKLRWRGSDKV